MKTTSDYKFVDAVPMVRLAETIDKSTQAVRYWIIRGKVPSAFRERKFAAGNARWMVPHPAARDIALAHGRDPSLLDQFVVSAAVGEQPQNKQAQR